MSRKRKFSISKTPALIQNDILQILHNELCKILKQESIIHDNTGIESFITRCRVSFIIPKECIKINEIEEIKGPSIDAKAVVINGFCKKHSIISNDLIIKDKYYYYRRNTDINKTLINVLQVAIISMSKVWPRRLKWNNSGYEWIRPVRSD